jgi:hypothetical protein
MCFDFSLTFLSETFPFCEKNCGGCGKKNVHRSSCIVPVILVRF